MPKPVHDSLLARGARIFAIALRGAKRYKLKSLLRADLSANVPGFANARYLMPWSGRSGRLVHPYSRIGEDHYEQLKY